MALARGDFLGLCETLGYLMVRGDSNECFFEYGYSVNLISIDITEDNFEVEGGIPFNLSKLEYENPGKEKMRQAVLNVL